MMPHSCIYVGRVYHRRFRPRAHKLSYRCYWLFVDLGSLEGLARRLRFFSLGRFNLFSMKNADHGTGNRRSFVSDAAEQFRQAGIETSGGKIFLLTMPRILGYGFNPLSVYYAYRADGTLAGLMYEVHNTFGQRHSYLIANTPSHDPLRQSCDKRFYVSPFLDMDLAYAFHVAAPDARIDVTIHASDSSGTLLTASLTGDRRDLSDRNLLTVFATHPLVTLKVIAAIHWEALRLWWKGVGLVPRPAPPDQPVTIHSHPTKTKAFHE